MTSSIYINESLNRIALENIEATINKDSETPEVKEAPVDIKASTGEFFVDFSFYSEILE